MDRFIVILVFAVCLWKKKKKVEIPKKEMNPEMDVN